MPSAITSPVSVEDLNAFQAKKDINHSVLERKTRHFLVPSQKVKSYRLMWHP